MAQEPLTRTEVLRMLMAQRGDVALPEPSQHVSALIIKVTGDPASVDQVVAEAQRSSQGTLIIRR